MLKCNDCDYEFEEYELENIRTTFEAYYDADIPSRTPCIIKACPNCHSDDYDVIPDDVFEIGDDFE